MKQRRDEPSWHDLPGSAKRQIRALLEDVSERHPQGHYGAAARAALDRLPEIPSGRLPPRRTPKGKELSRMILLPATREGAFQRIVAAVKNKGSILRGAASLGVHKWTLFQYFKKWPALKKRVDAVNPRSGRGSPHRRVRRRGS
jgi:hypothetical protein